MGSENARLEGRVAQILNARELVINLGSQNGVRQGMKFAVLAEFPIEIHDPVTNEMLGVVDREKVRVEATEVRERIAICRTYRTTKTGGSARSLFAAEEVRRLFEPERVIVETLAVQDSQLPPPLKPEESYVKINDRVILIEEPEVAKASAR